MTVFRLNETLHFPSPHYADPDGLLAIGGDLSPQRLLLAYRSGIFPWYSEETPILWWSPDPRLVLFPRELKIPKSLQRVIKKGIFQVTFDKAFRQVMEQCALVREEKREGTWIFPEMIEAYCRLHDLDYAHSVESWHQRKLVGGLYGVSVGHAFFGESMFMRKTDASKVALVYLVRFLQRENYELIDCQMTTSHLQRFGAREIHREEFLARLEKAVSVRSSGEAWILPENLIT
jgi:leucyl/phenylalanyl-tRNA--protein transferase